MTLVKIYGLVLAIGFAASINAQTPSTATTKSSPKGTLILKVGAAGTVSVDGRVSSTVQAGQVITLSLQPGQHLILQKLGKGKTIERMVTIEPDRSVVESLEDSSNLPIKFESEAPRSPVSSPSSSLQLDLLSRHETEKLRVHARITALDTLNLCTELLEEIKRFNAAGVDPETFQKFAPKRIEHYKTELKAEGSNFDPQILLCLGQPERALLRANEEVSFTRNLMTEEEESKGKCDHCNGIRPTEYSVLAHALIVRAVALFVTGEQEQAIREVPEAQRVISQWRSIAQFKTNTVAADQALDDSFGRLAAMKALAGDWKGCAQALRETSGDYAESPNRDYYKNPNLDEGAKLGFGLFRDCTWLAEDFATISGQSATAAGTSSSIRSQIDDVVRSGKYSALPRPQVSSTTGGGSPSLTIKNSTRYNLTVLCGGPEERSTRIAAGQTAQVPLAAGSYQMVGRVDSPNVLPLYSHYDFNNGTIYNFDFFISTH